MTDFYRLFYVDDAATTTGVFRVREAKVGNELGTFIERYDPQDDGWNPANSLWGYVVNGEPGGEKISDDEAQQLMAELRKEAEDADGE